MEIRLLDHMTEEEKKIFLPQMALCDWDAGNYLYDCVAENSLDQFGKDPAVLFLTEGDRLASFCTYVEFDEIDDPAKKPWIGFVYTFPAFRGRRCAGQLIEFAVRLAEKDGYDRIFVSSEEKGLYEKYGFVFLEEAHSVHGYDTGVFVRRIR